MNELLKQTRIPIDGAHAIILRPERSEGVWRIPALIKMSKTSQMVCILSNDSRYEGNYQHDVRTSDYRFGWSASNNIANGFIPISNIQRFLQDKNGDLNRAALSRMHQYFTRRGAECLEYHMTGFALIVGNYAILGRDQFHSAYGLLTNRLSNCLNALYEYKSGITLFNYKP